MKRILCSFLLLASLLAGLIQPAFATEEVAAEPPVSQQTEAAEALEEEEEATELPAEAQMQTRSPQT